MGGERKMKIGKSLCGTGLAVLLIFVCLPGCKPRMITTTATIITTQTTTAAPVTVTDTFTTTLPAQTLTTTAITTAIVTTITTVTFTPTSIVSISLSLAPAEAYKLIQANTGNSSFVILDLRTPAEVAAAGKIANSILLDYNAGVFDSQVGRLNRSFRYVIYCKSGIRSGKALLTMKDLDFKEVYEIAGGTNAWIAAGLPVINGP
jgi:rhodanese-related sulfurtransferase